MTQQESKKLLWDSVEFTKMYSLADRLTGTFAVDMLQQANFPAQAEASPKTVVLDTACGTGVVSRKIMQLLSTDAKLRLDLTCADLADSMIDFIKSQIENHSWTHAKALKADAQDTKLPSDHFSHVFFNFGPMLLPNGMAGLKECYRVLQPGGTMGFTTWEQIGWLPDFRAAFEGNPELPKFPPHDELARAMSKHESKWDTVEAVESNFKACGFTGIEVVAVPRQSSFTVDEFVSMVPGTLGVLVQTWNEDQRKQHTDSARDTVVSYMRQKYGDNPVVWDWTAIVATGKKPE